MNWASQKMMETQLEHAVRPMRDVRLLPFCPQAALRPFHWEPSLVLWDNGPTHVPSTPPLLSLKCVFEGAMHYRGSGRLDLRSGDLAIIGRSRSMEGEIPKGRRATGFSIFVSDDDLPGGSEGAQALEGLMLRADPLKAPLREPLQQLSAMLGRRLRQGIKPQPMRSTHPEEVAAVTQLRLHLHAYLSDLLGTSDRLSLARPRVRQIHASRLLAAKGRLSEIGDAKPSIKTVAEEQGYSQPQFSRLFSDAFGVSPLRYRDGKRLFQAREMVKDTLLPFRDIAESVGYGDYPTFSKAFRRRFGASPDQVRRRRRA